eukprot:s243_g27.t1
MAAGIGLRDYRRGSQEAFQAIWDHATDYVLIECLDDRGSPQGHGVGKLVNRYRPDADGAFMRIEYIGVSDPYYLHWVEEQGGSAKLHHICRHSWSSCCRKVGKDQIVHVQRLAFISSDDVESCLKEWKVKRIDNVVPGTRRKGLEPVEDRRKAEELTTSAKSKALPPHGSPPGDGRGRGAAATRGRSDSRDDEDDRDVGRSNAPRRRRRRKRSQHDSKSPHRCRPEEARGSVGEMSRRHAPAEAQKSNPLDAMLDDEGGDPLQPDEKLEFLRKSLEDKKKKRAEGKEGASAVLARRVQTAEAPKKRKKTSEKDVVKKALKTLASTTKQESSSSEADSEEEEDTALSSHKKDGDLLSRQRRLKKICAERPGALLTKGFALMHEQLGTLHGDPSGAGSKEEVLQPGALRYLLSTALPMTDVKKIGEERMRELRTLATTLDLVVTGKVSMAGDYLMQRYKSILMALRDGSTAASRYLELVPLELYPTASTLEETDYARDLALRGAKSQQLLARVASSG